MVKTKPHMDIYFPKWNAIGRCIKFHKATLTVKDRYPIQHHLVNELLSECFNLPSFFVCVDLKGPHKN